MRTLDLKVELTYTEPALGIVCNNPEVHREFIASQGPDAESMEAELEAIPTEEAVEKSLLIFPRMEDGAPFWWDYQIKGAFKGACSMLQRADLGTAPAEAGKKKEKKNNGTESGKITAYKKVIDGLVFVKERQVPIVLPSDGVVSVANIYRTTAGTERAKGPTLLHLTRPLRAQTAKGERVSLSTSEVVPAGSKVRFTVRLLNLGLEDAVREWLDYGEVYGLSGWRNAGFGRFTWTMLK
jgi:hypothetical protein